MENNQKDKKDIKFIDIHETTSNKRGIWGLVEVFLRRHKTFAYLTFYLIIVFVCLLCVALSLWPLFALVLYTMELTENMNLVFHAFALAFASAMGLIFGTVILLISTIFFNKLNVSLKSLSVSPG